MLSDVAFENFDVLVPVVLNCAEPAYSQALRAADAFIFIDMGLVY